LLRGVEFAQVPTTLLAQVDSGVGGKTGVNTRHGKNLVGVFHQPCLVVIDPEVLATLPAREVRAGYAEIAKCGALGDAGLFAWLEDHGRAVLNGDPEAVRAAVLASCRLKALVVAADEREQTGRRALLNLGHTFGHALETWYGYDGRLLHGEGVAVGMVLAARLSTALGLAPAAVAERLARHLRALGLPAGLDDLPEPKPSPETVVALMATDKKTLDGRLTLVLLQEVGAAVVVADVAPERVREILSRGETSS
jgi:3-dehydroquinate synthase